MPECHFPRSTSALLLFSIAHCCIICTCTVIAFSFVYTERAHPSHQHSVKQTSLHRNGAAHPHHPSHFRFIQGLLPEDNLQTSPILLPVVLPHVPGTSTQYSWNSRYLWSLMYYAGFSACLIQAYMGRSFCIMQWFFFLWIWFIYWLWGFNNYGISSKESVT